ncbi:Ankyrin repeat protein 1 [Giardia duodenalis]|uniref:Ankyrin repeat protein 1 n=1 Tax=Giardia intestinalis (strain ATCC 50803 / WB clone C6) TaxID=184922 RepID=A8B1Z6_GIAIC|nr:Ankyrin repeat protein 1 [Giardia intestinalis]KAE8302893.1 Ankyrin repeat protein 1 [Giardia intestinalis]|eukprot:XP_001709871.1 Protein 21.1 [Giardia lamblia ATCC 50803]
MQTDSSTGCEVGVACNALPDATYYLINLNQLPSGDAELTLFRANKLSVRKSYGFLDFSYTLINKESDLLIARKSPLISSSPFWDYLFDSQFRFQSCSLLFWHAFIFLLRVIRWASSQGPRHNVWLDFLNSALHGNVFDYLIVLDTGILVLDTPNLLLACLKSGTSTIKRISDETTPIVLEATLVWALGSYFSTTIPELFNNLDPCYSSLSGYTAYQPIDVSMQKLSSLADKIANGENSFPAAQILKDPIVRRMEILVDRLCLICRSDRGFTQLMTAAKENNENELKKFIYQSNLTSSTPLGLTALMVAIRNRSSLAAKVLVPYEACSIDSAGSTALMYSVQNKLYDGAEALASLECGIRNKENKTAIYLAYEQHDHKMLEILAPWENHLVYDNGKTLLMIASSQNNISAVNILLKYEAGVSDRSGHMASRYALLNGHREVFNALLPAEQSIMKRFSCTPLMIAVAQNDVKQVSIELNVYPRRKFKGITALMIAVLMNSKEEILEMLEAKEARMVNTKGQTALMLAVQRNLIPYVTRLAPLEAGIFDKRGHTALMYAIQAKNIAAVKILICYETGLVNPYTGATAHHMIKSISETEQDIALAQELTQTVGRYETFNRDAYGNTPLIHAVIANNKGLLQEYACQAKLRNFHGRTALHFAVELGNFEVAQELLELGAGGLQDYSGVTALMIAATNGQTDLLDLLLSHEAGETRRVTTAGKSALILALENGHTSAASTLAIYESGIVDEAGAFAAKIAAMKGYTNVFTQLYEQEKNLLYNDGFTHLMLAAIRNDIKTLRQNMQTDARTALPGSGMSALMLATIHGNQEACRLLLSVESCMVNSEGKTALMLAAERDLCSIVKMLSSIEAGLRDYRGTSALMIAAMRGHPENVAELMRYEAGIANNAKQTAASLAYWSNHKQIFCMLAQAELSIRDARGNTELMKAVMNKDIKQATAMVHLAGCKNFNGETALMIAVKERFYDGVVLLADLESSIQDVNGTTALIIACENSFIEAVTLLLKEINIHKLDGSSPRSVALARNHFELGRLLPKKPLLDSFGCTQLMLAIEAGDETLALTPQMLSLEGFQDYDGKTALMYAAEKNMCSVVEALVGVECKVMDYSGKTAAVHAYLTGSLESLAILIRFEALHYLNNSTQTIFMQAVVARNIEVIHIVGPYEAGYQLEDGTTALSLARTLSEKSCERLLEAVLQYEAGNTAPRATSLLGQRADREKIISFGSSHRVGTPEIEEPGRDNDGNTALIRLVRSNSKADISPLLHQAGLVNRKGMSALMFAAELNNVSAARLLAEKEAGYTVVSHISTPFILSNATALHIAAIRGNTEIVQILVEQEAGMVDYRKRSALMLAAYFGHLSVVQLLLGREKALQDSSGRTALFYAIESNKVRIVQELLPHEATLVTTADYMAGPGFTALMDAARLGNIAAIKLLMAKEGGMTQPQEAGTHSNWTALVWASSHGQREAVLELAPLELEICSQLAFYYAQDASITDLLTELRSAFSSRS